MKRLTLFMAALICLATSALAQIAENQTLSTTLWKQGIATCAHYTAHARGFAKKIDEIKAKYPQGYTLDDLNEVYSNQGRKWEKIYNEFKDEEGKNGSISDLKELVTPQIWKLVEPEFQAFITDHPEAAQEVPAQPQDAKAEGNDKDTEQQQAEGEDAPAVAADGNSCGITCPADLPLWLGILGSLLGLCALLTALSNRGKIKEMRRTFARELDRTNANLQEFSTDAADQMKALSIRLTGKAIRNNEPLDIAQADEEPEDAVKEELMEEVEPVAAAPAVENEPQQEEEGEVMNLFMSKPDDNDDFTRVSDTFEPGNSIYVLTTFDGQHGTFEVIDKPEVHRFALMMPAENLIRACSGNAIQIPSGSRIITDRAGEAEFIDGRWHVVVKAIIHYEG
ncbi:MAG: hypothetical protein IJM58_10610 [Muribaculaceae bacterium]|nr:hypothetical protein [Muribaculaceae bacterium]